MGPSYTSITAPLYTSLYLSFCVLNLIYLIYLNENSPINLLKIEALQYFIQLDFFKYWIKNNPLKKIYPFYESNQHLFPRACKMSNPISQHSYRDCMMSNNISLTEFFFLEWWFKNRPNIFHRGFSSQVKWIKKIDQK